MRRFKLICQILIAFIIAQLAFTVGYEPYQEQLRDAVRQHWPLAGEAASAPLPEGRLKITVLDVGQGDAILLQDSKRSIMVDVGDYKEQAALETRLQQFGVQDIQTVFITHHHNDHMGNIMRVMGKYHVRNIYDNGVVNESNGTSVKLDKILRKGGYHNRVLQAGDRVDVDKGYYFEVLGPGDFMSKKLRKDHNNSSLVMKLHYGDFTMLFTGDIENPTEAALAKRYGSRLKADVLKVAHHGSRTSSNYQFISRVQPKYALISCGDFAIYKHPNSKVISTLEHLGAKVYYTRRDGSLVVETDGKMFGVEKIR